MRLSVFYTSVLCLLIETYGFPWKQDIPVCTSQNKLCDVSFDVRTEQSGPNSIALPSNIPMCRCPGISTCPNGGQDPARVFYQEMTSPGMTINTKLSFCDVTSLPKRLCKSGEVAMTLRGFGPIFTQLVGGINCKCREPLRLKKAYPIGMLSERQYACGQKTCQVNSSARPVCERVIPTKYGMNKISEIPCRCPRDFFCDVSGIGLESLNRQTEFYCEPTRNWKK